MKKVQIPADIKAYVSRNVIKKIICWALLTLGIVLLITLYGEKCFHRLDNTTKYIIYTLLALSPVYILKMYRLIDKSWCGELVDIEIRYTTDSNRGFKPTLETLYTKETVIFHVKVGDKIIKRKAYENAAKNSNISSCYRKGDFVAHIYGTDYIQIINEKAENVICVVCGLSTPGNFEECHSCHHTLKINVEE